MSHVIKVRNIPLRYSPNLDFKLDSSGACKHRSPGTPHGFPQGGQLPVQESQCHCLEHSS